MDDSPRVSLLGNSFQTLVDPVSLPNAPTCCSFAPTGRKLIVAFDGTSNRFGRKNTNVVELYHRIEKDSNQCTYYNSGIGTYAKPSWRFWSYWGTVIENIVDLALAWNFQKIVMGGYRWLSENYREGDQIFLFGFSRGAYQARVLAGMIERVGLIFPGNEEQIPFAYELYASSGTDGSKDHDDPSSEEGKIRLTRNQKSVQNAWRWVIRAVEWISLLLLFIFRALWVRINPEMEVKKNTEGLGGPEMALRFKETFCRRVRLHFVGLWDTVSSVGISRNRALPLAHSYEHICFFRHALALDECRVKFLPEYVHGGVSWKSDSTDMLEPGIEANVEATKAGDNIKDKADEKPTPPPVKEVWFAGSHSDVGGGIKDNKNLDLGDVPCLWMANEAMVAGLKLKPSKVEWDWDELRDSKPTVSMKGFWTLLEWLPLKRLTYGSEAGTTRDIHLNRSRIVKPGQKIHASVAFKQRDKYKPKATFSPEMKGNSWDAIIGKGRINDMDWAVDLEDILELDLFDHSQAGAMLDTLKTSVEESIAKTCLERLSHLALYDAGIRSITTAESHFQTLTDIFWSSTVQLQISSGVVLYKVASNRIGCAALHQALIDQVFLGVAVGPSDQQVRTMAVSILARMDKYPHYKMGMKKNEFMCGVHDRIRENNTVQLVVECIKGEGPEIQDFAAEGLIWLAKNDQVRAVILATGIINSLAEKLESQEASAQCSGAKALSGIAKHDKMRAVILQTNTIVSLAKMLKNPNEEVKYAGLRALSKLARYGEVRTDILKKTDAIESLVGMLSSQHSGVRISGADALAELSKLGEIRAVILTTTTIYSLVEMVKSPDGKVQRAATGALSEISKHGDMRHAILETRAIESLASMLKPKNGSQKTSQSAADALCSLAKHDDIRPAILEIGAIRSLASMLKGQDDSVKLKSIEILMALAQHGDVRSELLQTDAVLSLVRLFKSHGEDIPWSAIQALSALATYEEVRPAILKAEAVNSLARMLKNHIESVQQLGINALVELIRHDALRTAILETDAVKSLARTLRSQDRDVQSSSVNALTVLLKHDDSRAAILGTDFIISFVDILNSQERDVQMLSANVLIDLANYGDVRAVILEKQALTSLMTMLQSQEQDVQSSGAHVIAGLARHDDIRASMIGTDAMVSLEKMLESQKKDVQSSGISMLAELVQYDDARASILRTNAILLLVTMLESEDQSVQSLGAQGLSKVARHDDIRATILRMNAVGTLAKILKSQKREAHVLAALAELIQYGDIRTAFLETDAVDSLVVILRNQEKHLQSATARALTELLQHDKARAAIFNTDAITLFWAMASNKSWDMQLSASLALSTLAEHDDTSLQIGRDFSLEALTNILELLEHQDSTEREKLELLLKKLLQNDSIRSALEDADMMHSVKSKLNDYDPEETWEEEDSSPILLPTDFSI